MPAHAELTDLYSAMHCRGSPADPTAFIEGLQWRARIPEKQGESPTPPPLAHRDLLRHYATSPLAHRELLLCLSDAALLGRLPRIERDI